MTTIPEVTRADLVALGVRLGWIAFDEKEELGKVRERLSGKAREVSASGVLALKAAR